MNQLYGVHVNWVVWVSRLHATTPPLVFNQFTCSSDTIQSARACNAMHFISNLCHCSKFWRWPCSAYWCMQMDRADGDTETLPLEYDPATISAYWARRPVSVITRIFQLLGKQQLSVQFSLLLKESVISQSRFCPKIYSYSPPFCCSPSSITLLVIRDPLSNIHNV